MIHSEGGSICGVSAKDPKDPPNITSWSPSLSLLSPQNQWFTNIMNVKLLILIVVSVVVTATIVAVSIAVTRDNNDDDNDKDRSVVDNNTTTDTNVDKEDDETPDPNLPPNTTNITLDNTVDSGQEGTTDEGGVSSPNTIKLPRSSADTLITLTLLAADGQSFRPVGRSYAGRDWETSAGPFAGQVTFDCTTNDDACFVTVPPPPQGSIYQLHTFDKPKYSHRDIVARFLEQTTFGPTKDALQALTADDSNPASLTMAAVKYPAATWDPRTLSNSGLRRILKYRN